ncbi:MAG: hypothetical protein EXS00_08205 [Phycisphaerales bacterium]|nr:hypothetical protein [Phycisphaerales bacterium]
MIFGWKKSGDSSPSGSNPFVPQPGKAREWITRARGIAAQGNTDLALLYFAMGVRLDPGELTTHDAIWEAAVSHLKRGGKPATSADLKNLEGNTPADKFAISQFQWMRDINNLDLALACLTCAGNAELGSYGQSVAVRVMNILRTVMAKKPNKKKWLKAKAGFSAVDAWEQALACGQEAYKLDPSDGELMSELNQLSAAHAIQQGGYKDNANQEGGFRANIKDLDKQRELEEAEAIVTTSDVEARNIERAKTEYEANPNSPDALNRYGLLLRRRQTPADEALAIQLYLDGFERMTEYRLRMAAGDIQLAQARRKVSAAQESEKAHPADAVVKSAADVARGELLDLERREYTERIERYPTDRAIKFELGRVLFSMSKFDEAMACFQAAKEEARFRVQATQMLGRCFAIEGWHSEAISEFREALQGIDSSQADREQDIRYDLMSSLIESAKAEKSSQLAREAGDICSSILRKDISFRDIRAKRKEVDTLVRDLS